MCHYSNTRKHMLTSLVILACYLLIAALAQAEVRGGIVFEFHDPFVAGGDEPRVDIFTQSSETNSTLEYLVYFFGTNKIRGVAWGDRPGEPPERLYWLIQDPGQSMQWNFLSTIPAGCKIRITPNVTLSGVTFTIKVFLPNGSLHETFTRSMAAQEVSIREIAVQGVTQQAGAPRAEGRFVTDMNDYGQLGVDFDYHFFEIPSNSYGLAGPWYDFAVY